MIDLQVAYDKLAGFKTAEEIADFFRSEGVVGYRGDAMACPIANWTNGLTGLPVQAGLKFIYENDGDCHWHGFPTTLAMREFIIRFDMGAYLDLVHPWLEGDNE